MASNETEDLERLMNEISAVDSASAQVSADGDLELDDLMPDMDGIDESIPEVKSHTTDEKETDVVDDYRSARNNVHWLMAANKTMIVNNARLSKATTHPKNFEVHQKMVETQLKLCEALINLSGSLEEGKVKSRITRTNKILDEKELEHENNDSGNNENGSVKVERRPTQSALFEAVAASRKVETQTGNRMSADKIKELAFKIDEETIVDAEETIVDAEETKED